MYVDGTVDVIGTVFGVSTAPDTAVLEGSTGGANSGVGFGPSAGHMTSHFMMTIFITH